MNRKTGRGKDMSWDLRALGGAVQLPCGELAWTKPQIFRVLASVEAMRGVVLGGDVLFGNGTYTGSSWQYCLSCEDHYVAFLPQNGRGIHSGLFGHAQRRIPVCAGAPRGRGCLYPPQHGGTCSGL